MTTHKSERLHADQKTLQATGTIQWLLEKRRDVHPYTPNNLMKMFICGEEAFKAIEEDIRNAKESVDLVCWGFDPGMELVRPDGASQWPRGVTYGDLLVAVAAGKFNEGKPVKVRLLAWYNGYATNAKMNNLIGYTGWMPNFTSAQEAGLIGISLGALLGGTIGASLGLAAASGIDKFRTKSPETLRDDYCVQWWKKAFAGHFKNLEIRFRGTDRHAVVNSLHSTDERNKEARQPGKSSGAYGVATEKLLLERGAAHHQKPILIDYAHGKGERAIGYVMGLNSVTDYWDTQNHVFDDLRRERDFDRKTEAAKANRKVRTLDPYRDYACRLQGDVLFDLNRNFEHGWNAAQKKTPNPEAPLARPKPVSLAQRTPSKDATVFHGQAQIIRTQPDASTGPDKTIKEIYLHVSETAIHYLYAENQYFFYQEWADHLKAARRQYLEGEALAGRQPRQANTLHLFIVAPQAEDKGFIPRMYDTAKSLGLGQSTMPKQADKVEGEIDRRNAALKKAAEGARASKTNLAVRKPALSDVAQSASEVSAAERDQLSGELKGLNLKVLMARPVSFNTKAPPGKADRKISPYRQIYVHSKLLLADDAFMTVGSANLNQRSMAADSEINVATDCHDLAANLRRRVWGGLTANYRLCANGELTQMGEAFQDWMGLLADNKKKFAIPEKISGKLIPFEEERTCSYRVG